MIFVFLGVGVSGLALSEEGRQSRGSRTTGALPIVRSPFMAGVQTLPCPSLSSQNLDEFCTTRLQPGCRSVGIEGDAMGTKKDEFKTIA